MLVTPLSARLAAIGAVLSFGIALGSGSGAGAGGRPLVGGLVAFVVPYLAIAALLRGRSVGAKAAGTGLAALLTWLSSSALPSAISGIQRLETPAPTAFLALMAIGAVVTVAALAELIHATVWTGYLRATPWSSRLAFLVAGYFGTLFVSDTYLTANPPPDRMLLAPVLMALYGAAALMLRGPARRELASGTALAAGAVAATLAYSWLRPDYVAWGAPPPAVIDLSYYSLLPWPLLLGVSVAAGLAITALGLRQVALRDRPARRRGLAS